MAPFLFVEPGGLRVVRLAGQFAIAQGLIDEEHASAPLQGAR